MVSGKIDGNVMQFLTGRSDGRYSATTLKRTGARAMTHPLSTCKHGKNPAKCRDCKRAIKGTELPREPSEYDNPDDPIVNWLVDHAEAVRVVKSKAAGRTIFIRANGFAPSKNQDGVDPGHTRGRDVMGSIVVTKRAALRHLDSDYSERTRNECFVRLTLSNRCMWIG